MNLQSMTIIFVVIFLPIIIISTYFIQTEVDTIAMQASYDTKLIDAAADAISAFEINTANEDLSTNADSLRSIIEASNNVFTTTLATNLGWSGASKSQILPYIPAVVYTLYDGYYIYAPTAQPKVAVDDKGVYLTVGSTGVTGSDTTSIYTYDKTHTSGESSSSNDIDSNYGKILYVISDNGSSITCTSDINNENIEYTTKYILKSYSPYTMKYKNTNCDVVINYTLDNFISVRGTIDGVYYNKSGYLIDLNSIISINDASGDIKNILSTYKDSDFDVANENSAINKENIVSVSLKLKNKKDNSDCIITIDATNEDSYAYSEYFSGKKVSDAKSALAYYAKSYKFTKWFTDMKLHELVEGDITTDYFNSADTEFRIRYNDRDDKEHFYYDFSANQTNMIFETNGLFNVNLSDSNFAEHKRHVIQNSIQYNLNKAMSVYNAGAGTAFYQMPVISEVEWDNLLSNVSILAFMQGLECGLKTYSNYAIVTSTNNEIMTNPNDIYYYPIYDGEPVRSGAPYDQAVDGVFNWSYFENAIYRAFLELDDAKRSAEDEGKTFTIEDGDKVADRIKGYQTVVSNYVTNRRSFISLSQKNMIRTYFGMLDEYGFLDPTINLNAIMSANDVLYTAHRLECNHMETGSKYFESFPSKDYKYDKVWKADLKAYEYDHMCEKCYYCLVNSNLENNDNVFRDTTSSDTEIINRIKAEAVAIAKIRNNTYKMLNVDISGGVDVKWVNDRIDDEKKYQIFGKVGQPSRDEIYQVEVTYDYKHIVEANSGMIKISLGDEINVTDLGKRSSVTRTDYFKYNDKWNSDFIQFTDNVSKEEITIKSIVYKYK